jgi:hypothetical protein
MGTKLQLDKRSSDDLFHSVVIIICCISQIARRENFFNALTTKK